MIKVEEGGNDTRREEEGGNDTKIYFLAFCLLYIDEIWAQITGRDEYWPLPAQYPSRTA